MSIRVLVVTVVHDPRDARIAQREIPALLAAGDTVTFAAPFTAYAATAPDGVEVIDLPRAVGRSRVKALRAARRVVKERGAHHDIVLLHDPELVVATAGLSHRGMVWDVHEDTAAALGMKEWLPNRLRPATRSAVAAIERVAQRTHHLLLAEDSYAERFRGIHPVVPNTTSVPTSVVTPHLRQAVYVGRVSVERGGLDLIEVGRLLRDSDIELLIIGPADQRMQAPLEGAVAAGWLRWEGFVPNGVALARIEGSMAGLSLLHDQPNYRHSMPTKVIEYMARGIPVVSTPLPRAEVLVRKADCGVIVPFADPQSAATAVHDLVLDPARTRDLGAAGHAYAREHLNWDVDGKRFVNHLHAWAAE